MFCITLFLLFTVISLSNGTLLTFLFYYFILIFIFNFQGDTWIDYANEAQLNSTNSVSFVIEDRFVDIVGRNLTAISLLSILYIYFYFILKFIILFLSFSFLLLFKGEQSQFECVNDSTGYWGCDNHSDDFYIQV